MRKQQVSKLQNQANFLEKQQMNLEDMEDTEDLHNVIKDTNKLREKQRDQFEDLQEELEKAKEMEQEQDMVNDMMKDMMADEDEDELDDELAEYEDAIAMDMDKNFDDANLVNPNTNTNTNTQQQQKQPQMEKKDEFDDIMSELMN